MLFNHYNPKEIFYIHDINYFSQQELIKFTKLRTDIGKSLLKDCIQYIGLHKLLDFNEMEYDLGNLFKYIFTNYQPKYLHNVWLTWIDDINDSIENDYLSELKYRRPDLCRDMIDWINFKFEHYKDLNKLLSFELSYSNYKLLYDEYKFDKSYPYTLYDII